jgi:hypothetical protein
MTRYVHRVHAFAPAAPGWSMHICEELNSGDARVYPVALAGWVTLAEYAVEDYDDVDAPGEPTGSRSVEPGWCASGEVVTASEHLAIGGGDIEVWVSGPGEDRPADGELEAWRAEHAARARMLRARREGNDEGP